MMNPGNNTPETQAPRNLTRRDLMRCVGIGAAALLATRLGAADKKSNEAPAAPAHPPALGRQPGFYRFRIGAMEVLALSDGGISAPASKPFWKDAPAEKIATDLEDAAMPLASVELPFSNLLLKAGSELVLIDAGSSALFGPTAGSLPASMAEAGVKPEDVTSVFITHAHSDHFGGLLDAAGKELCFPKAKHFIGKVEYDYWTGENPDVSAMAIPEKKARGLFPKAAQYLKTIGPRWHFVSPGERFLEGFEAVDARGHTPGQLGLLISSGSERLLHLADAVHHHALSFANPEWAYLYDSLPAVAVETRRRLLDRAATERLRVFGSHMPFPGLGRVRKQGSVYEHVLEPWSSLSAG